MRNLDSCRCWRCTLCPCKVRNRFFVNFWNRALLLCIPCISNKMQRYNVYYIWKLLYMFRVEVPPETCRAASRYNKLCNVAYCWIYIGICYYSFFLTVAQSSIIPTSVTLLQDDPNKSLLQIPTTVWDTCNIYGLLEDRRSPDTTPVTVSIINGAYLKRPKPAKTYQNH